MAGAESAIDRDLRAYADRPGARRDRPASSRPRGTAGRRAASSAVDDPGRGPRSSRAACRRRASTARSARPSAALGRRASTRLPRRPAARRTSSSRSSGAAGSIARSRSASSTSAARSADRPAAGTTRRAGASPAVLLVDGVDATGRRARPSSRTGRTYVWTAPLASDAIHPVDGGGVRDGRGRARRATSPRRTARSRSTSPIRASSATSSPGPMPPRAGCCSSARSGSRSCWPSPSSWPSSSGTTSAAELARLTRRRRPAPRPGRASWSSRRRSRPSAGGGHRLGRWRAGRGGPRGLGRRRHRAVVAGAAARARRSARGARRRRRGRAWRPPSVSAPGGPRAAGLATGRRRSSADRDHRAGMAGRGRRTARRRRRWRASMASPIVVLLPPALAFLARPRRGRRAAAVAARARPALARALRCPSACRCCRSSREPGRPAATLTLLAFSLGRDRVRDGLVGDAAAGDRGRRRLPLGPRPAGHGARDRAVDRPLGRAGRPLRDPRAGRPGGARLSRRRARTSRAAASRSLGIAA